jgi:hypothetical protein
MENIVQFLNDAGTWIVANLPLIAVVAAFIVAVIYDKEKARQLALTLFLTAEKLAVDLALESGPDKMRWALDGLLALLGLWTRSVFTVLGAMRGMSYEAYVAWIAQKWYDAAKAYRVEMPA